MSILLATRFHLHSPRSLENMAGGWPCFAQQNRHGICVFLGQLLQNMSRHEPDHWGTTNELKGGGKDPGKVSGAPAQWCCIASRAINQKVPLWHLSIVWEFSHWTQNQQPCITRLCNKWQQQLPMSTCISRPAQHRHLMSLLRASYGGSIGWATAVFTDIMWPRQNLSALIDARGLTSVVCNSHSATSEERAVWLV